MLTFDLSLLYTKFICKSSYDPYCPHKNEWNAETERKLRCRGDRIKTRKTREMAGNFLGL